MLNNKRGRCLSDQEELNYKPTTKICKFYFFKYEKNWFSKTIIFDCFNSLTIGFKFPMG